MDASASEVVSPVKYCTLPEQTVEVPSTPPIQITFERRKRICYDYDASQGLFPLAASPSVLLHVLTDYGLDAQTLASLEATCTFFRRPAQLFPDTELSFSEIAALDMCNQRDIFKPMIAQEREYLKKRCGGSWKLVLRFLLAGEACTRREKAFAVAGPGHSIAVARNGDVYSFGINSFEELGNGTTEGITQPCRIKSLHGIRIIQATVALGRTILVSDAGRVYEFVKRASGDMDAAGVKYSSTPQLVESLKDIFVVQAVIGNFVTAFLSREGTVYTVSWGKDSKLGHERDLNDLKARPLLGALENVPVVQIAAGYCFLLALAYQPSGMSVYSVGCGLGGKLGHGTIDSEKHPRLIEEFQTLNLRPKMIAAGPWHSAVVGEDGRVCTWGWGRYGCLGHGDKECQSSPKVVEGLSNVKAVHIATGEYTTFVVSEDGNIYSFGFVWSRNLWHNPADPLEPRDTLTPELVTSLKKLKERIVQISVTNFSYWQAHRFALTESGKLYAFGSGDKRQLGIKLAGIAPDRDDPELVNIDLS